MEPDFSLATSDADLLIHLAHAGHLRILPILFRQVYIPKYIFEREIRRRARSAFVIIQQELSNREWLFVEDPDLLPHAQKYVYREKRQEAKSLLDDPGEAEGIALAEAKGIRFFASNDTKEYGPHDLIYKKRYLEVDVRPLTHQDLLFLAFVTGKLSSTQCEQIHQQIRTTNHLHKMPETIRVIFAKSAQKLTSETWFPPFLRFHHVPEIMIAKLTKIKHLN